MVGKLAGGKQTNEKSGVTDKRKKWYDRQMKKVVWQIIGKSDVTGKCKKWCDRQLQKSCVTDKRKKWCDRQM